MPDIVLMGQNPARSSCCHPNVANESPHDRLFVRPCLGFSMGQDDERNGMDGAGIAPGDTATRQAIDA
ncbi:MAG: hypothetical protein J0H11_23580 [Rhizobiales bacterium]|nr:hypothetical protein [Hyphomicrobiales bacterium]